MKQVIKLNMANATIHAVRSILGSVTIIAWGGFVLYPTIENIAAAIIGSFTYGLLSEIHERLPEFG